MRCSGKDILHILFKDLPLYLSSPKLKSERTLETFHLDRLFHSISENPNCCVIQGFKSVLTFISLSLSLSLFLKLKGLKSSLLSSESSWRDSEPSFKVSSHRSEKGGERGHLIQTHPSPISLSPSFLPLFVFNFCKTFLFCINMHSIVSHMAYTSHTSKYIQIICIFPEKKNYVSKYIRLYSSASVINIYWSLILMSSQLTL